MKKLILGSLILTMLGCSALVEKSVEEVKDWSNVGVTNEQKGSVYMKDGKFYYLE